MPSQGDLLLFLILVLIALYIKARKGRSKNRRISNAPSFRKAQSSTNMESQTREIIQAQFAPKRLMNKSDDLSP